MSSNAAHKRFWDNIYDTANNTAGYSLGFINKYHLHFVHTLFCSDWALSAFTILGMFRVWMSLLYLRDEKTMRVYIKQHFIDVIFHCDDSWLFTEPLFLMLYEWTMGSSLFFVLFMCFTTLCFTSLSVIYQTPPSPKKYD